MRRFIWIGAGIFVLGVGLVSCSNALVMFGCNNPSGYCGGSSNPDPDRIGGPRWFLWQANAEERLAFYRERCSMNDHLKDARDVTSCAVEKIRENALSYCVLYDFSPAGAESHAEDPERNNRIENCKQDVLGQHDF